MQRVVNGPVFYEFAPGTVKPLSYLDEAAGAGARNVGPRISNLTPYNGDYTLTAGAQVSGLEIFGRLIGRGDATTKVSDCIIHGSSTIATSGSAAALGTSYNFGGATIEWCRIDLTDREGAFTDAIDGGNYKLRYSEVLRGVDGIGANTTGNVEVHCCRVAKGYYFSWWNDATGNARTTSFTDADGDVHNPPFPGHTSGDTHSDGVQIQQAAGWVIRGCYIGGARVVAGSDLDPTLTNDWNTIKQINQGLDYKNAAILISSATGSNPVGALIENNWLHGGEARFNIAYKVYDDMSGVTVQNNRFIRTNYGYYIFRQTNCAATFSNNVYDDTGTAVPIVDW